MSGLRRALPELVLVTGNRNKLVEAEHVLGFRPEHVDIDLPEIQSLHLHDVLRAKAEEAWRQIGRPLLVEETGLELDAMGGFPGPLIKWMLAAMGVEGVARTAHALGDAGAVARTALLYRGPHGDLLVEGACRGLLAAEPRGTAGFGWDPIFIPEESHRTYAELSAAEKGRLGHRGRAWRALVAALENAANPTA